MATRKNIAIGEALGKDPEQVQNILARVNPSTRAQWIYCAEQIGCDVDQLQAEAAKPAPTPLPAYTEVILSVGAQSFYKLAPDGTQKDGNTIKSVVIPAMPGRPDGT